MSLTDVNLSQFNSDLGSPSTTSDFGILEPVFAAEILRAYDSYKTFDAMVLSDSIESGVSKKFPITGGVELTPQWGKGEALSGGGDAPTALEIGLDNRPMAAHFEVDKIDDLVSQFGFRAELSRQVGETLATERDRRVARLVAKAALEATTSILDSGSLVEDTSKVYADGVFDNGSNEAKALKVLETIDAEMVRRLENNLPTSGIHCAVAPAIFMAIRTLGVAREAAELVQAPMFGGVAEAGGLGQSMRQGMGFGSKLEYNGVSICASNHVPSTNVTSGDANYQVNATHVAGLIWSPSAVASLTKQGISLQTEDDVRRNSTLVIGSMYNGGGVLRPELAAAFGGSSLTAV